MVMSSKIEMTRIGRVQFDVDCSFFVQSCGNARVHDSTLAGKTKEIVTPIRFCLRRKHSSRCKRSLPSQVAPFKQDLIAHPLQRQRACDSQTNHSAANDYNIGSLLWRELGSYGHCWKTVSGQWSVVSAPLSVVRCSGSHSDWRFSSIHLRSCVASSSL